MFERGTRRARLRSVEVARAAPAAASALGPGAACSSSRPEGAAADLVGLRAGDQSGESAGPA